MMNRAAMSFVSSLVFLAAASAAQAADFFPVARVQTKEGFNLTAIQRAQKDQKTCQAANARFTNTLKSGCKTCQVSSSQCKGKLTELEQAAIDGKALRNYSVSAPGVRVVFAGKTDKVKPACEQIASQSSEKGAKTARCLAPGQPA